MARHRNVLRIDRENFHGFVTSVKRRGQIYNLDHFSDRRPGGREKALRAALRRRDELEAVLPPATHLREKDTRSKTGVVGLTVVRKRKVKRALVYYCANWVELNGKRVQRSFAVAKYGRTRARALAERARLEAAKRILSQHGARTWWQRD